MTPLPLKNILVQLMNLESRGFEKDFGVIEEASINPS